MAVKYVAAIVIVLLALSLSNTGAATSQYGISVIVSAGQWDRHNTLVSFPNGAKPGTAYHLVADKSPSVPLPDALKAPIPVQVDGTTASFVLPELKAGQNQSFHLVR